ncbi:MAG: amino acid permease [Neisseriaceae bacterium]
MSNVSINRQIGSIFVVVGTEVGAGILALPILIAHIGFPLGLLIMLISWFLMTYTALLVCEANLAVPDGASFAGIGKKLLNPFGQVLVWVSFLMLLYTIMVAYISAAASAFNTSFPLGTHLVSLIFVGLLGCFVVMGTSVVDWVNRFLLGTKLLLLLFVCFILLPHTHASNLSHYLINSKTLLTALPVFVTAFTSHLIIPPLRTYLRSDAKVLGRVIIIGSIIPLILYVVWIVGVIGVIPLTGSHSFSELFARTKEANIGDILELMKINLNNSIFYAPVSLFSNISVTTSFLGVSLALFYFLIDAFKLHRLPKISKNVVAIILTFLIPLMIVWFFPNIFIKALGYVGLCCSVLLIILPFFMIQKLKAQNYNFKIKYTNNNLLLWLSLIIGIFVIAIELFI